MQAGLDPRTRALDVGILSRAFERQTNWSVITGAPCSGKSTVIRALQGIGHDCRMETARAYIDAQAAIGVSIHDLRRDEAKFQSSLIAAKVEIEKNTDPSKYVFFDRAMPDSITYFRMAGLNPNDVLQHCFYNQYANVFIFDRLPFEKDNARTEDIKTAEFIDRWLENDYRALGYNVIRVPVMSLEDRISCILNYSSDRS